MAVPQTLYKDLLDRYVLLELAITALDSAGNTLSIGEASPRIFTPMGGSWPRFFNYVIGVQFVRPDQQHSDHTIRVGHRLLGGPIGAGYQGEMEDRLNYFYFPVTDYFDARPHLNSPADDTQFNLLKPNSGAQLISVPTGTQGFQYSAGESYFGAEWISEVTLRLPRSRRS